MERLVENLSMNAAVVSPARYQHATVFALRILLCNARVCDAFMDDPSTLLRLLGKRVLWSEEVLSAVVCSISPDTDADEGACASLKERFTAHLSSGQAWSAYASTISFLYAENPECVLEDLQANLDHLGAGLNVGTPSSENVAMIRELLELSAVEVEIVEFAKAITHRWFRLFGREIDGLGIQEAFALLASALRAPISEVRRALRADAPLRNFGVLRVEITPPDLEDFVILGTTGKNLISNEFASSDEMRREFMGASEKPQLEAQDFQHLATELRLLTTYLRNVSKLQVKGANILLYGPPGTGKSEFARLLTQQAGLVGYEVPAADRDGLPVSGHVRLTCFSMCQRFLERMGNAVLIFDEIEDVFAGESGRNAVSGEGDIGGAGFKGWLNHQLENARAPSIWISNSIDEIDPAVLRRFSFHIQFRVPPKSVRERVIRRCLNDMPVTDGAISALASDDTLSPAQISFAGRFATLSSATNTLDEASLIMATNASQVAMGRAETRLSTVGQPKPCKLEYLNLGADTSIEKIEQALCRSPSASLCLYGVSGAGKTSLAHHIADAIDRPIMLRRASDVFGMYLGQSEKRIAQMFREATAEGAVLLLDEADSFLQGRAEATQSWQVTVVNELLQQMEAFNGVFICTTNLMGEIDPAAMRRFTFKIRFDVMTLAQREALFAELVFGEPSAFVPADMRGGLAKLVSATPGDFSNVQRQITLLGDPLDAGDFLRRLVLECSMKHANSVGRMGFLH